MQHSSAAVAFFAALTFAVPAFGQTSTAIAVVSVPADDLLIRPPPCTATFCKSIVRYENKSLLAVTEYNPAPPCKYLDHGEWTPGTAIQPRGDHDVAAGTVDVSQPAFKADPPPGCDNSGGPYYYQPIYFKWTLRKNLTAVDHYGPTATFNSRWKTLDNRYDVPYSFQITVPVVRPKGETTRWAGWNGFFGVTGTVGEWIQTLQPPDDAGFDFSGETVRERFVGGLNTCPAPPVKAASTTSEGSSWPVTKGNEWGPDGVGFGDERDALCSVVFAQCVQPAGCTFLRRQQMQINSPADPQGIFTNYGGINTLIATNRGRVFFGTGYGSVSSIRGPGGSVHSNDLTVNSLNCVKGVFPKTCQ